mgnify:FL=1|jgi:hypothetical protein|tara:strand:+ start:844 stop:1260 length:417 start_codon:yes stop_codon:yes gene_type:complete
MATRSNANKGVTGRNSNVPPPARNTQDNTQAIRRIPGMSYGEQQELTQQQQAAPLPKDKTPEQPRQTRPFTPVNVFSQSQLPDQPITDGAALGPGRQGVNLTPQEIGDLFIVALAEKFPTSDTFALADDGLVRFDIDE